MELAALDAAGISHERDDQALALGQMRLRLKVPQSAGDLELVALYPDFFPIFKPLVYAPTLVVERHQNPTNGELCLLGRRTENWYSNETLAGLIKSQLPPIVDFANTGQIDALLRAEESIGEPASDYYNSLSCPSSFLLVESHWEIPPHISRGTFTAQATATSSQSEPLQGYISEVFTEDGQQLAHWSGPRPRAFNRILKGAWVRHPKAISCDGPDGFFNALSPDERTYFGTAQKWPIAPHRRLHAIVFPEETAHRVFGTGWIVAEVTVPGVHDRKKEMHAHFVRVARAGQADIAARMPSSDGLRDKRIAFFGLGAIGAPAALEFARAGVGAMALVDGDHMDPATLRRWPVGWSAFGRPKVDVIKEIIEREYPWTISSSHLVSIGLPQPDPKLEKRQGLIIEEILSDVDLIMDATAEMGVNHLLSGLAAERRIPYLLMNASPGAWGGMVASFNIRNNDACWMCFRHALYEAESLPLPPADLASDIQAPGCGEMTFSGASFDLQEVSLEGVRVAVSHLAASSGYPSTPWQYGVLSLRNKDGSRRPPTWEGLTIPKRPGCTCSQR